VAVLGEELPRTGRDTTRALLFGGVALVLGGLLLLAGEWLPAPIGARGRRR
jgi:LPXTG-motif cell wall-anchored protein